MRPIIAALPPVGAFAVARKKSETRKRTVVAYARMTPEEYAEVQDKAAASGNTVSAFIRPRRSVGSCATGRTAGRSRKS